MAKKKGCIPVADANPVDLSRKIRLSAAASVFALSLILYLVTLAPTVTLVDSGELILAAHTSGVAHPPGFPLYVMLASLASYLPFGEIAVRVHLLSAVCGSLAAGMMTLLSFELLTASGQLDNLTDRIRGIAPPVFAGSLFAVSRTLWAYSTIAEVYALNTLLIVTVFWLIIGWRRRFLDNEPSSRRLYLAAFIFGLALGVHHVTVALMLPALAMLVFSTAGLSFFRGAKFLYAALAAIAGSLVYVFLPIAASRSPLMNWGDPSTPERFWWHISGRQYQAFFEFSFARISEFGSLVLREYGYVWLPVVLVMAVAGASLALKKQRPVFWFLILIAVVDLAYCLSYEIAEDKDAYYLPAFVAITVTSAFGAEILFGMLRKLKLNNGIVAAVGCVILLGTLGASFMANLSFNNRSRNYIAHDYVTNILRSVEPRGMLLTSDWQVYSPSLYVREVEGLRKDAIFLNINQLRRTWYFEYLEHAFPEVTSGSRAKIDGYLEDLRAWEKDPSAYSRNAALEQRINSRFFEMIMSMIEGQATRGPVYVTAEIATNRGGQDVELTNALMAKYKFIPKGLVFETVEKEAPGYLSEVKLNLRGLTDGSVKFDAGDVTRKKVIPVYLSMAMSSGMYFASSGRHDRAIELFRQALTIDPAFEPAKKALETSQSMLQNRQK